MLRLYDKIVVSVINFFSTF